jgi:hypothetical protein
MTMNHQTIVGLIALTLSLTGCATTPYNPFKVSREEILTRYKVVAVAPCNIPDDLSNVEQLRSQFNGLVEEQVKACGFQVVPAAEYDKIYTRLRAEAGALYDPQTGKADEEKFKQVADLCRRELVSKFHADAVLYSSVIMVKASYYEHSAKWDGVNESITTGSFLEKFFSGGTYGTVGALSLWLWLKDPNGEKLYSDGGGLQLLSKIKGGKFVPVPLQDLLADTSINSRAVGLAFKPLREEPVKHERSNKL